MIGISPSRLAHLVSHCKRTPGPIYPQQGAIVRSWPQKSPRNTVMTVVTPKPAPKPKTPKLRQDYRSPISAPVRAEVGAWVARHRRRHLVAVRDILADIDRPPAAAVFVGLELSRLGWQNLGTHKTNPDRPLVMLWSSPRSTRRMLELSHRERVAIYQGETTPAASGQRQRCVKIQKPREWSRGRAARQRPLKRDAGQ
jgi:hypothetical protein